ncbi:MAG: gas vesicle protein GvpG [Leptolyngbyaceae cyanobacterium SM2_5_2]|nr:gas vesicle protein GvpG [Leptolyngbyaceae cyanobacterium SM2_5_2]
MLLKLLFAPVLGPIEGVAWIADKILDQSEITTNDRDALQKQLLAVQLAFDMGELSEEAFTEQETEILEALQKLEEDEEDYEEN